MGGGGRSGEIEVLMYRAGVRPCNTEKQRNWAGKKGKKEFYKVSGAWRIRLKIMTIDRLGR
jgi:hypothetical protein